MRVFSLKKMSMTQTALIGIFLKLQFCINVLYINTNSNNCTPF